MADKVPTATAERLGQLLGLSAESVRDLCRRGIIKRRAPGAYELAPSIAAYCAHLREVASGRGGQDEVVALAANAGPLAREQADAHAPRTLSSAASKPRLTMHSPISLRHFGHVRFRRWAGQ